jgi:hypothetical protein
MRGRGGDDGGHGIGAPAAEKSKKPVPLTIIPDANGALVRFRDSGGVHMGLQNPEVPFVPQGKTGFH